MLRYKICVLFLLIIGICTFHFVKAGNNDLPLLGKVIYLDPGHGGICLTQSNERMTTNLINIGV